MKTSNELDPVEIQELARRVRLRILHEDDDVVLLTAPNDEELASIVRELLSYKPMNLKEIHQILSGIASEDKIRKALNMLLDRGEVYISNDGKYVTTVL
ncbi:MAG: ArsR family transcriptional regulator [Desulfurococcaceae archaeon]